MDKLLGLGLSVLVSLLLSTLLVAVLSRPLRAVLQQLCPGRDATAFWVAFTAVMLYVAPLFFTALWGGSISLTDLAASLRTALTASLFGSFSALLVVGYQVSRARPLQR